MHATFQSSQSVLARLNEVQGDYCTTPGVGVSAGRVSKMLKCLRLSSLCDGQGADRRAIMSNDRSYSSMELQNGQLLFRLPIARGHIYTDITTCNFEEPQQKYALEQ